MAYGDAVSKPYEAGAAPTDSLAARDLARSAVGSLTPMVQEVTHEITGHATLIKQVTTAGTRVRISASALLIRRAVIVALPTNSGVIAVGDANVVAALGTQTVPTFRGVPLYAGEVERIEFNDLTNVWIDSAVNGDGVTVWYMT